MSPLQQGQNDGIANTVTSQKNSVRLDGLKANARYMVQVRARTVAGYGRYSLPTEFQTTAEGGRYQHWAASITQPSHVCSLPSLTLILPAPPSGSTSKTFQELPLIVGSATAGLVFVIVVVVIAIVCFRYWLFREEGFKSGFGSCSCLPQSFPPYLWAELWQLQSPSEGLDRPHVGPRAEVLWEDCASASPA